ncbi:helix-turn-helix domain-containing protein [Chitinophagaceae bacterium MMS25-I14]
MELHTMVPMRLKHYRRKASLTQHAMARLLHIDNMAYRSIERGARPFSVAEPADMKLVSDFCSVLQLSIAEFLTGSNKTESKEAEILQLHWDLITKEVILVAEIREAVSLLMKATAQLKEDMGQ